MVTDCCFTAPKSLPHEAEKQWANPTCKLGCASWGDGVVDMCKRYQLASRQYVRQCLAPDEPTLPPYNHGIVPRNDGPFMKPKRCVLRQWGMIRPGSTERIQRAALSASLSQLPAIPESLTHPRNQPRKTQRRLAHQRSSGLKIRERHAHIDAYDYLCCLRR